MNIRENHRTFTKKEMTQQILSHTLFFVSANHNAGLSRLVSQSDPRVVSTTSFII